eukprot:6294714-Amphidinium_carterae.1
MSTHTCSFVALHVHLQLCCPPQQATTHAVSPTGTQKDDHRKRDHMTWTCFLCLCHSSTVRSHTLGDLMLCIQFGSGFHKHRTPMGQIRGGRGESSDAGAVMDALACCSGGSIVAPAETVTRTASAENCVALVAFGTTCCTLIIHQRLYLSMFGFCTNCVCVCATSIHTESERTPWQSPNQKPRIFGLSPWLSRGAPPVKGPTRKEAE